MTYYERANIRGSPVSDGRPPVFAIHGRHAPRTPLSHGPAGCGRYLTRPIRAAGGPPPPAATLSVLGYPETARTSRDSNVSGSLGCHIHGLRAP